MLQVAERATRDRQRAELSELMHRFATQRAKSAAQKILCPSNDNATLERITRERELAVEEYNKQMASLHEQHTKEIAQIDEMRRGMM